MKRFLAPALAAAILALPSTGAAQIYGGTPGAQEYLDFVGAGPAVVATWGGVYLGPYTGQFLNGPGGSPTGPQFSLYCVDYLHTASDQWVNVTALGSGVTDADMGSTRLESVSRYTQAAYLSSLFDSWGDYGTNQQVVWSGLHSAIWSIMSGVTLGSGETADLRNDFLAMAEYNTGAMDGWYVLSPVAPANGQEFLIRAHTVPEPSTYMLLATGLLLLVVFGRRRLSLQDEAA